MTLDPLWHLYQQHGYAGLSTAHPRDALGWFYCALIAFAEDDLERAAEWTQQAVANAPNHPVYTAALRYLTRVRADGKANVYVDGDAFAAFIRGGGNVGLYAAVSAALRVIYGDYAALRLLDIGVGDGMALLPALLPALDTAGRQLLTRLDVIEPSAAMLSKTITQLNDAEIAHHATNSTIQAYIAEHAESHHWDVIQATWSLQSIPPAERPAVFDWCRAHGDRLLIAEFDVPAFETDLAPDRVSYIVERFAQGLGEYEGDQVAQGFLMPVMFGYFDRSAARTNWEGPIQQWVDGLRAAGFTQIETRPLFAYFWADAVLIDVR